MWGSVDGCTLFPDWFSSLVDNSTNRVLRVYLELSYTLSGVVLFLRGDVHCQEMSAYTDTFVCWKYIYCSCN